MLLHAIAATTTHQCVVSCDDTNVVLPLYYYSKKNATSIKVRVGKYTRRGRVVPIHAICTKP